MAHGVQVSPNEKAEFEAFMRFKAQAGKSVSMAATAKAVRTQDFQLPNSVTETADEYLIHVPKRGPWHVSASGKSEVVNIEALLPKGSQGIGVFGKLFRPL
jgi:hypothetical protein